MKPDEMIEDMDASITAMAIRSLSQEIKALKKQIEGLSAKIAEVHEQTTALVEKTGW